MGLNTVGGMDSSTAYLDSALRPCHNRAHRLVIRTCQNGFMNKYNQTLVGLLTILVVGCATTGDPIIVTSQKATSSAFYTIDLFVHLEKNNRALADSISPQIHVAAQKCRLHGPQAPRPEDNYIEVARRLTSVYEMNKSDATKSQLQKALADLDGLVAEAQKYTTVLQSAKAP